jgi:hypothetical protein
MTGRRVLLVLLLVVAGGLAGAAVVRTARQADSEPPPPEADTLAMAPPGVRIRVQVLNATTSRGFARRATMHLRDRGFDVVEMGTSPEQRDSTLVVARSRNPRWAELVAAALEDSAAVVQEHPDSSRYLDVTVLLGRSWRPPAEPFYP